MNQTVEIIRGTTEPFTIEVVDVDGALYSAADGETVILGIKRREEDPAPLIAKAATMTSAGIYVVVLLPGDTQDLECGKYFYDVSLQSGEHLFNIIEPSPIIFKNGVTTWGCVG